MGSNQGSNRYERLALTAKLYARIYGASGRDRTGMIFRPADFESAAPTNYATEALCYWTDVVSQTLTVVNGLIGPIT